MRQFCREGKRRKTVCLTALIGFLMGGILLMPSANAQSSALSFQECLDKQKELRDEGKSFSDRAWAIVQALQGAKFFTEESNALYKKGAELMAAADALHCVSDLGRAATDADKLKKFDDIDRILADKAILNPAIKDFVNDRFEAIDKDNQSALAVLGKTELAIRDSPALGIESAPDANSLGNPQTLGNSRESGKYSTMVEVDIKAAEEAEKKAQAEAQDAARTPQSAPVPPPNASQASASKSRPVVGGAGSFQIGDRGEASAADLQACSQFPDHFARIFCIAKCSFKKYTDDCKYIIKEILPRKLYDARRERESSSKESGVPCMPPPPGAHCQPGAHFRCQYGEMACSFR
jgi:hypothetical protein